VVALSPSGRAATHAVPVPVRSITHVPPWSLISQARPTSPGMNLALEPGQRRVHLHQVIGESRRAEQVRTVNGRDHSALAVFASELRHARARHGLSQDQLADKIAYSASLVGMVESCRGMPSLDFAQRCDEALATGGVLARLHPLVAGEAYPAWFRPFVELERVATSLRAWEPLLIPGLMQTEDYARAILRASRPRDADPAIDQLVTARLARQGILARDNPPDLWVIIDEGVLRRPVGEPGVMAAQLDRLLTASRAPWVTVQVMPASAGAHPGLLGPFVIAGFADAADVAYLDSVLTAQGTDQADRSQVSFAGPSEAAW
jgi:transcriptional regulator with XRE-family HTH domain